VSIPRGVTGCGGGGGGRRASGVGGGFRGGDGGKGEGGVGRLIWGRGRAVDAMVEEEGEDRRDRNERVRADVLGVVGVGFRIVFGIVFENSVI
jgi:hypothetical protein